MNTFAIRSTLLGSLGLALALSAGNAAAVSYSFTNIADSSGAFSFFDRFPALNDSGTVAFSAPLDNGVEGIFTGNGGPTTTIADSSGPFSEVFGEPPALNNGGTVTFSALLDNGVDGIFTGSGGPTTTLYEASGPFNSFGFFSVNDSGTVAFEASLSCDAAPSFSPTRGESMVVVSSASVMV